MPESIAYKLLALAFSASIGVIGLFSYSSVKSWSHPAVVFPLFWFFISFIPMALTFTAPIVPWGTLYIAICLAAFSAPSALMSWSEPVRGAKLRGGLPKIERIGLLFVAFVALQFGSIACLLINLSIQGIDLITVITDPVGTANNYLKARYNNAILPNSFTQIGIIANYVGVPLGGMLISRKSLPRNVATYLLAFTPSLGHVLIYADKGTIFLCIAYFVGGLIVRRIRWGETALLTWRAFRWSTAAAAVVMPLMIFAIATRYTGEWAADEYVEKALYYVRSYAFSHIYAFSDWFSHFILGTSTLAYTDPGQQTLGFWTFMAIGEKFWPSYVVPDGYFDEYFVVPGVMQSNIYTMFRGLIYDFGLIGGVVFFGLFGWLSAVLYRWLLLGKNLPVAQSYYIFLLGYIYSSYLISLTLWASSIAAAIGIFVVLWVDQFCAVRRSKLREQVTSSDA